MGRYDNMFIRHYNVGVQDIDAPGSGTIHVPYGYNDAGGVEKYGFRFVRVLDVHAFVTETFTNTTTPGHFKIGLGAGTAELVDLSMGVAAAGADYGTTDYPAAIKSIPASVNNGLTAGSYNQAHPFVDLVTAAANLLTNGLTWTVVAPTGGTPGGIAIFEFVLGWF